MQQYGSRGRIDLDFAVADRNREFAVVSRVGASPAESNVSPSSGLQSDEDAAAGSAAPTVRAYTKPVCLPAASCSEAIGVECILARQRGALERALLPRIRASA